MLTFKALSPRTGHRGMAGHHLSSQHWSFHVTTQAEAINAARTYRQTQPQLDELKDVIAANTKAKKTLGAYMVVKKLSIFRGVELRVVPFSGWDWDKLRAFLGDKAGELKKPQDRQYFSLHKRGQA